MEVDQGGACVTVIMLMKGSQTVAPMEEDRRVRLFRGEDRVGTIELDSYQPKAVPIA